MRPQFDTMHIDDMTMHDIREQLKIKRNQMKVMQHDIRALKRRLLDMKTGVVGQQSNERDGDVTRQHRHRYRAGWSNTDLIMDKSKLPMFSIWKTKYPYNR